jgi:GT2 family glycosyltransferase
MINISIVLYHHQWSHISSLVTALKGVSGINTIYLIDNSPAPCYEFNDKGVQYIFTGSNRGYGAGHNIALRKSLRQEVPYHLVVNPDIEMKAEDLNELIQFMESHPDTGQLMPKILYPDGSLQYLCKLLPTPTDLFIRRFLPASVTRKRMYRFEMQQTGYQSVMEVPYLSGCFMLLRTSALKEVGLFDERFFMYPEDIDITRRMHQRYKTLFYPQVSVIHHHEQSSYSSLKMLLIHLVNLMRYFNKWGWVFDPERKKVNQRIIQLNQL